MEIENLHLVIPIINRILKPEYKECRMCGKFGYIDMYNYVSPLRNDKFIVCKKCAIREYYGTKAKQSKRYKKDKNDNNLFREKISSN